MRFFKFLATFAPDPREMVNPPTPPGSVQAKPDSLAGKPDEPEVVTDKEEDDIDPETDIDVPVPKLPNHQIDIPEEPEKVTVVTKVWNENTKAFEEKNLGELMLVPTGCEEPEYVSPYENTVSFRSALPRDKERDANLYASYQQNGWISRRWARENLDEDIDSDKVEKELADDIPVILALQGKQDVASGVAQTAGLEGKGDNNGAPLPPGPGPGRGNKAAPGDNGASTPGAG